MDGQRTDAPPTVIERAASASVAGACGAAIAAGGSYAFLYGLSYQFSPIPGTSVNSGAGGTITALFFLLLAVAMSVGGGALLSKALGVSTWQRSTLISAAAHAIGLPLWIVTHNGIVIGLHTPGSTYGFDGLVAFPAAAYAFVVPLIVVFSTFRRNAAKGLAITLPLWIGTCALAVTAVLRGSEGMAVTSGVVAWVVLPAVSVLGSAMIEPRNR
jgi:hypothetical protein